RRAWKKDDKTLDGAESAFVYEFLRFGVAVPGLGHMAVRGDQAVTDEESGTGNTGANIWTMIRESDLIHTIDVSDGIAIAVENNRGHRLLLPELIDLSSEFVDPLLEVVGGKPLRGHRTIVMDHRHGSHEHHDGKNALNHLLPALANNTGLGLGLGFWRRVGMFGRVLGLGHTFRCGDRYSIPVRALRQNLRARGPGAVIF